MIKLLRERRLSSSREEGSRSSSERASCIRTCVCVCVCVSVHYRAVRPGSRTTRVDMSWHDIEPTATTRRDTAEQHTWRFAHLFVQRRSETNTQVWCTVTRRRIRSTVVRRLYTEQLQEPRLV